MKKKTVFIPLTATLLIQVLVSMTAVTVPIFAPMAAADVGISATSVGLFVGLIYIASMFSSMWSPDFISRYGAMRVSQISMLFCAIGLALTATASIPMLGASALILGLGYGPVTPASSHILSRSTPPGLMSFVFSIKQTGVTLGGAIAGALVPVLVVATNWKITAVLVAALCGVGAILAQSIREEIDADRHKTVRSSRSLVAPLKLVIDHKPLLRLAMVSFSYAGMQLCLITYLVVYLTQNIGMALISAGITLSIAQISGTAGRLLWGIVADRLLKPPIVLGLVGVLMSLGAIATACFSKDWPNFAIWAVIIVYGASAIGWNGVFLAEGARLAPDGQAGTATGGLLFFTYLGVVAGPPIFAAVAALTDNYTVSFLLFGVLALASAWVAFFSKK